MRNMISEAKEKGAEVISLPHSPSPQDEQRSLQSKINNAASTEKKAKADLVSFLLTVDTKISSMTQENERLQGEKSDLTAQIEYLTSENANIRRLLSASEREVSDWKTAFRAVQEGVEGLLEYRDQEATNFSSLSEKLFAEKSTGSEE